MGSFRFLPASLLASMSAAAMAMVVGCAAKPTAITAQPEGVFVSVNGQGVGNAPTNYTFDFGQRPSYVLKGTKTGFFDAELNVTPDASGLKEGRINLALQPDPAYRETTVTEANNKWLRIQVSPDVKPDSVWQKMIDTVTGRYVNLEQLDNASGYLRSVSVSKTYKHPVRGAFSIRTQFLAAIAQKEPLVYKVRIQSDISEAPGQWSPYDRVFTEDAQMLEELQSRLGLK
jgi:hypothetical protein